LFIVYDPFALGKRIFLCIVFYGDFVLPYRWFADVKITITSGQIFARFRDLRKEKEDAT
jgi:hypothetical protein